MRLAQLCRVITVVVAALGTPGVFGDDWPQFRGPGGAGVSTDANVPVKWSDTENLLWKLELPGRGASSPIVLGDRVFVTCYSGYGVPGVENTDVKSLQRIWFASIAHWAKCVGSPRSPLTCLKTDSWGMSARTATRVTLRSRMAHACIASSARGAWSPLIWRASNSGEP